MDLHVVGDDSLPNYEIVVVLHANVTELLRLNVSVLDCCDLIGFVVKCDERVSHLEALLAFSELMTLPLSTVSEEEVVGRAPDLAAGLECDDYLAADCACHHFGHFVLFELLGLLII